MPNVIALDNAIVDILLSVPDSFLADLPLEKGICNFVNEEELALVRQAIEKQQKQVTPGGSAANMSVILSELGTSVGFCNAIGNDEHGRLFRDDLAKHGVRPYLAEKQAVTGTATTFVTPDAQRTFATHLGASQELLPGELPLEDISETEVLFAAAYVLEGPLRSGTMEAIHAAKKVALDLSDPALVHRNKPFLARLIEEHVDIVFANEKEAKAMTGKEPEEALEELSKVCEIAIVKIGEHGSLVHKDTAIRIPAHRVHAIDTTGAGDAYAAGFLHGILQGWPLEKAGDLGSLLASKIIQVYGARLEKLPRQEIRRIV